MYLSYDRRSLDIQYSPSSCVADIDVYLRDYAARSAAARRLPDARLGVRYGPRPEQLADFYPAGRAGAPMLVFVHGGYWQEMSRHESAFMAPDLVARGISVAVLGYGLAPAYELPEIIAMVADGIRWICRSADRLPGAPGPIVVSGHSAGAHLVAMSLLDESGWERCGARPSEAVAGAILVSGVYDLEPVRETYVNEALGLDAGTARACSPLHNLRAALPPLVVARGENETDEFGRQQTEFVTAVRALGGQVTDFVVPIRNHFDLPYDLGDPETLLGDSLVRLTGRSR
ncbi:alpha/beta hydrolase [Microbispora sp. CA-135349]|uniref:alpha/beta hydrolase n=1 Tax=Microbispora sp. CA-135349 TaxID=3239953 RepID=UPI003D8A9B98